MPPVGTTHCSQKESQTKKLTSHSGKALQSGCSSMLPPAGSPRAKGRRPLEPRYRYAKLALIRLLNLSLCN
jgi:hypothetical protein